MNKELALLKTLLQKDFYDDHKGIRCPDKIFTKDMRKIKQTIDYAMQTYETDLSVAEIEALFFARNSSLTTANKVLYQDAFTAMQKENALNKDIAEEVLSRMFQQVVGEEVANLGFDFVNGNKTSLEPLRELLQYYNDDFLPALKVEWEDTSIQRLLELNGLESKWKFNIPSLTRRVDGISGGHLIMVGARPNVGKCLRKGTKVIMADGTLKAVEDIAVGDKLHGVYGKDKHHVNVTALGNGFEEHYRITLRDGSYFDCNASHILCLKRKKPEGKHKHGDIINVSVAEYLQWPEGRKSRYSAWRSPTILPYKELPMNPYLLGAWLGDGTSSKPQYTIAEAELVTVIRDTIEYEYRNLTLKGAKYSKLAFDVVGKDTKCNRHSNTNGFMDALRDTGLLNNKHIPADYFLASFTQRLEVLCGIIDTDGYYHNGIYEVTQKNVTLANDIVRLAHSLGMAASIRDCEKSSQNGTVGQYKRIRISPGKVAVPCVLQRKRHTPNENTKDSSMQSFTVEPIGVQEYFGFTLDGNNLFMVDNNIVTHNTSFHATLIAAEGGFAHQGAKCLVLVNEEAAHRVGARYLTAATNMTLEEVKENPALAGMRYQKVKDNIHLKDCTGRDMTYVEQLVKLERPDIVILDMGDKFAAKTSDKSDVFLKDAAIYARNIAKQYDCGIFWMSQLSAEAEGRVDVNMSMMEGSKTGKAAEADLMLLLSKNALTEGQEEEASARYITVAKNKVSGWHGRINCELDGARAIYTA